jgi:hypothetical protein
MTLPFSVGIRQGIEQGEEKAARKERRKTLSSSDSVYQLRVEQSPIPSYTLFYYKITEKEIL